MIFRGNWRAKPVYSVYPRDSKISVPPWIFSHGARLAIPFWTRISFAQGIVLQMGSLSSSGFISSIPGHTQSVKSDLFIVEREITDLRQLTHGSRQGLQVDPDLLVPLEEVGEPHHAVLLLQAGGAGDEVLHHLAVSLGGVEALEDAGEQVQLEAPQVLLQQQRRRNVGLSQAANIFPGLT